MRSRPMPARIGLLLFVLAATGCGELITTGTNDPAGAGGDVFGDTMDRGPAGDATWATGALDAATPSTTPSTGAPTQPATQAPTDAPTQPPTEAPTQPPTEAPTQPPTEAPTQPPTEAPPVGDLEFCVQETNRYRRQVGRANVVRNQAIERYAAEGAEEDHHSGQAHGHFIRTGGGGVAHAENACPGFLGWYLQGSVQDTIAACLAAFFAEGPGGGHYENMVGNYGSVGCGWYIGDDSSMTIVQDLM